MAYRVTSSRQRVCHRTPWGAYVCRFPQAGFGDDVTPVSAGALQAITGGNVPVDATHISALQRELNRFADPKSPIPGPAVPVTGVLDDATATRALQILMTYYLAVAQSAGDVVVMQNLIIFGSAADRIAWITTHITTAYSTIKAFGDAKGLPSASGSIPTTIVIGAAVVGALLLLSSAKSKKRRR